VARQRPRRDARRAAREMKESVPLELLSYDELQDAYDAAVNDPDSDPEDLAELELALYRRAG
jgi:hypothetical protein